MKYKPTPGYAKDRKIAEEIGLCPKIKPKATRSVYIHDKRLQELKKQVEELDSRNYTEKR